MGAPISLVILIVPGRQRQTGGRNAPPCGDFRLVCPPRDSVGTFQIVETRKRAFKLLSRRRYWLVFLLSAFWFMITAQG
jgi:hypothetical protein